jgi:hypothetical protein
MNIPPPRDRWMTYTNSLTWSRGSLDNSSWFCFLRAGSLQINPQDAVEEVAKRIKDAGDSPKRGKLRSQVKRAYDHAGSQCNGDVYLPNLTKPEPAYQPDKLQKLANKLPFEITPQWLSARSLFSVWNRSPAGYLHKLYRPGEKVVLFDVFKSQGCDLWVHPGSVGDLSSLDYLKEGKPNGVWYMANPVDGEFHWNPRQGHQSRRSEESVTAWRYAVIESDEAPSDLWLKALVQLPLPIAAIYSSGGSSIHSLIEINAESKTEWDRIVREQLAPSLVSIGADYDAMTAVRLSRLPNCRREETGSVQSLLYLHPSPNHTPIVEKEVHGNA